MAFIESFCLPLITILIKKKFLSNANLVLKTFQVKLLPEVNKQVGGVISNAFFSKQILTLRAAI